MDSDKRSEDASSIRAIDKRSVHQICSGQVILSLATAVKELVENSIDAGATNVEIRLREFGMESIEVHDNGSGIEEKDFNAIAMKHCTSKLADFSDLTMIDTFGFRGEALSSLCALSKLAVVTRHHSKEFGCKLEFDYDGKLSSKTPCAREIGTTVVANQLFHTLPVRYKEFQRNIKKEFPKLSLVLQAYGIISTGVRLSCINVSDKNKKTTIVSTQGSDSNLDNISNIFGPKQVQNLIPIKQREPHDEVLESFKMPEKSGDDSANIFKIDGYISRVDHGSGRATADRQFYFINRRPCDIPKVSRLVNEVYHMFNRHQNPFVFLDISLNSGMVDVNITPDKRQIFVQNEKLLLATLKASLLHMFTETAGQYHMNMKIEDVSTGVFSSPGSTDQKNSPRRNLSNGSSLKFAKKDAASSCITPPNKQTVKDVAPEAVNKGLSISSVLKNLRGKFSRGPDEIPSSKSSQLSIEKFTHTVKRDVLGNEEETAVRIENEVFCNGKQLRDIVEEKKRSMSSASVPGKSCVINSPTSFHETSPGQNDSVNQTNKPDNAILVEKEINGNILPDSKINQRNALSINNNKNIPTSNDICDLKVVGDDKHCDTQCKDKPISIHSNVSNGQELPNDVVVNYEAHSSSNPSKALPAPIVIKVSEDLGPLQVTENPCKRPRFSRSEVKVPFDIKKLQNNLKLHLTSDVNSNEKRFGFYAKISPNQNDAAEEELRKNITKEMFKEMEIIGQFNLGFIITKIHGDLFIIDQHATDEKYNFETLQKEHCLKGQRLIQPRSLELTPTNESILVDNVGIFRKNGFEFFIDESQPSGHKVKLISLPTSKNWTFGIQDIEELLFMLSDSPGVMCRPSRVRNMFASRACRMSIMVGTALNQSQMKTLVNHMVQIEHPWNCPHGRPTMRHLVNLNRINKKLDSQSQSEE